MRRRLRRRYLRFLCRRFGHKQGEPVGVNVHACSRCLEVYLSGSTGQAIVDMTNMQDAVNAVRAERRRYEDWLSADPHRRIQDDQATREER